MRPPRSPGSELRELPARPRRASYAPYSHVACRRGRAYAARDAIVVGSNVENASYGLTLCAECSLVSDLVAPAAVGAWWPSSIVAGDGQPIAPCGRCRQVLFEHGGRRAVGRRRRGRRASRARRTATRTPSAPRISVRGETP